MAPLDGDLLAPEEGVEDGELRALFAAKYAAFAVASNARALPDVRDGFKVVHRRILQGLASTAPSGSERRKSAKIVGDVMGDYHPHGDSSIYDAMVRLAQPFENHFCPVDPQGNFGQITGDGASAMRYTEARLSALAGWLVMEGVDEGAVPTRPTYDLRLREALLLPVRVPMLLLNGVPKGSIGTGFATIVPPHNPGELCRAAALVLRALAEGREATVDEVLAVLPGPDFPGGCLVGSPQRIADAYRSGQGSVTLRAVAAVEAGASPGRTSTIVVTAIPYGETSEGVLESIVDAARGKRNQKGGRDEPTAPEVSDAIDQTDQDKQTKQIRVRLLVTVKAGEDANVVLEKLYKHTKLQTTLGLNFVALSPQGRVEQYDVAGLLREWALFRFETVRRLAFGRLEVAQARRHVVEGLLLALPKIRKVVDAIHAAADEAAAEAALMALLGVTTKQAEAIVAMRLSALTGLRQQKLEDEAATLGETVAAQLELASDDAAVVRTILADLEAAALKLKRPRASRIEALGGAEARSFVVPEESVVTISGRGYLKRTSAAEFRAQNRGGVGRKGAKVKADDALHTVVACHSHDRLLGFASSGAVARFEAHEVGQAGAGRHGANLGLEEAETVVAIQPVPWPLPVGHQVVLALNHGEVKRVRLDDLNSRMTKRLLCYRGEGEVVGSVLLPGGRGDVFLASGRGIGTRFSAESVRLSKRDSGGVRGMDLRGEGAVVSLGRIDDQDQLILCVTSDGVGKRTSVTQFPVQNRGGVGRILIRPRTGARLVAALLVREGDHVLIATKTGMTVRIAVSDIRELRREAQGVKLVSLRDGDEVLAAAVLPPEPEAEPTQT